jgi:hypothetical protein
VSGAALDAALALYTPQHVRTFAEDIALYARRGYVWCSPTCVAFVRPVVSGWDAAKQANPCYTEQGAAFDCWHVALLAGDMREGLRHLPYALPLVSFLRRGTIRTYRLFPNSTPIRHALRAF